jgi:uncharacterized protein
MLVYLSDKQHFVADATERHIEDIIARSYREATGRKVGESEQRSWRESLVRMANVLRDDEIPRDVGVAVELRIPQSAKRIDVTLSGESAERRAAAVIVELKQWTEARSVGRDGVVETFLGRGYRETVHPSYQAWSYAALMEGFNTAVYEGGIALHPCAYLHNYVSDGMIDGPAFKYYLQKAPLFLKGEQHTHRLRAFIKTRLHRGDGGSAIRQLAAGKTRPSKDLANSLAKMMKGNPEFVLIDEQKTVYEAGLAAGRAASADNRRVLVVDGGPGTGKTVVAINLLVALTQLGLSCRYVSQNATPRAVYKAKLSGSMRGSHIDGMFVGSGAFVDTRDAEYDVLIVDEAHRLTEKSGLYKNLGENQVKEIIAAAKCAIFFLDEDQRVTLRDIGSKELVEQYADEAGAQLERLELASQFRCNGSDDYLAWLDDVLQIRRTDADRLSREHFDFRVFDSPIEMDAAIRERNQSNKARVLAGYCWPWTSKSRPGAHDIVIGEYRRQWNLVEDGGLFLLAEDSIAQVGCIHTSQGLELEYVGVIIGPDLVVRDGSIVTDATKRDRHDQTVKGYKKALAAGNPTIRQQADRVIKNTYRTLMTRGMRGCFVYSEDEETRAYFASRLASEMPTR